MVYDKSAVQILVEVWDENTKPLPDKIVGTAELRSDTQTALIMILNAPLHLQLLTCPSLPF